MAFGHEIVSNVKNSLKRFSIYVMALLLFIGIVAGTSSAPLFSEPTYTVSDDYPVHNINTGKNYSTIQSAIDDSSAGDEIHVDSGTYYEKVYLNKQLILRGIGMPVVDSNGSGNAITLAKNANRFILEGFTVRGGGSSYAGIKVVSNNNTLIGNNASNNYYGIYLSNSNNNTLSNNNANMNNYYGIYLYYSHNNNLSDNNANMNNQYGISLKRSNNNVMSTNNVSNNNKGIYLDSSRNNNLTGNNVSNNYEAGISVSISSQNRVYNNVFNNIVNFLSGETDTNTWNTTRILGRNIVGGLYLGGNFWAKPDGSGHSQTCEDVGRDGICDLPNELDSNNIDYLPLTLPHTAGIITATLSPNSSGAGSTSAFMNFTVNDSSNTTAWYNITFPGGFDVSNANINLKINGSDNPVNWVNSKSARYVNISSNDTGITANSNMDQYINLSNITVASTRGNYFINVTTSNGITVSIGYKINEYGVNLTNISVLNKITPAATNATYLLSLTNNGTDTDTYTIMVTPGGASVASLNVTSVSLNSGETSFIALNVTNSSSGIFYVNVTATSGGDVTKFAYINTTTTVNALRGVNLTNISVLNKITPATTNATYYLSLTNNGTDTDTYTIMATPGGASVASLNVTSAYLNSGETRFIALNVTNSSSGIFYVNVTATSGGDVTKFAYINTTTTVNALRGVNFTNISMLNKITPAATNATYYLSLTNNGTDTDTYTIMATPGGASVVSLNVTSVSLNAGETRFIALNVTNSSSGIFYVNVTARSNNDTSKIGYINTTTIVPIVINITNPVTNGSITTDNYVNVTVILDANGLAQYLSWEDVNYTMIPDMSQASGTVFYRNMTDLFSGDYTFKVYANDTEGNVNVSETRTVIVDRTIKTNLSIDATGNVNQTVNISSPDGNATITIFNGTNATLDGEPIINITIDVLNNVNPSFVEKLGSDKLVGENLSLGPEGAHFNPDIQIRFNYTDEMLLSYGISASELRVKFYDNSSNSWIEQTPFILNEMDKYIIANVSHFSTFALVGTEMNLPSTPNGGNGAGGGGVITSEPYDNIARSETYEKNLVSNIPTKYSFKLTEHGIFEITVTGRESENNIALRVEALKGQTMIAGISAPPGVVYKNINIWSGSGNIKKGLIKFKVENAWISNNKVESGDLLLVKWNGSQWVQLVTQETMRDDLYTYYEANTDSFSSFAITVLKGAIVPASTPVPENIEIVVTPVEPARTGVPQMPAKKIPGFELIMAISLIAMLVAGLRQHLR